MNTTTFCAHCRREREAQRPAYFLPTDDVVPLDQPDKADYEIFLAPQIDCDNPHFEGEVAINVKIQNSVSRFAINSSELVLTHVSVVDGAGVSREPALSEDEENQRVWLDFSECLATGVGRITVRYHGSFDPKLKGFYLSKEITATGEESPVAVTQSEPADFRRWVPSLDQPDYKARVRMTVEAAADLVVRSNTPATFEEVLPGNMKRVHFALTNKLPTYVIAVAVGRLESSDPIKVGRRGNVEARVWAVPGKRSLMDFALEVVRRGLPLLEEFHGQDYPNKKLDLIALREFAAGAMENDGMFTFRDVYVLIDKMRASVLQKIMVAVIVLHEMDHTWDGNRRTMKNWSQLSLNEARATFMSYLIANIVFPELHIWENFALSRAAAMQVDGLESTRAIVSPIERLDQCKSMFDIITYYKGAAVLRMVQMFLETICKDGFEKGMQRFNVQYDWGNASTDELWGSIGEATGFDMPAFMDTWVLQKGFPSVTVTRASACAITVKQSRFTYVHGVAREEGQLWQVPAFLRIYAGDQVIEKVVQLNEGEQTFDLSTNFDWLVANAGGHCFYRVNYEGDLLAAVGGHVQSDLTIVERFNILSDAWALLQAGEMNVESYLSLVKTFKTEEDPNVWSVLAGSLSYLRGIADDVTANLLSDFVRDLVESRFLQLGWQRRPDETPQTTELRGIILGLLGSQKLPWFTDMARKNAYEPWLKDASAVDADVLAAAVRTIARSGDDSTYAEFISLLESNRLTPQEERVFFESLCAFPSSELANKTLAKILSKEIKLDMSGALIRLLLQNPDVRDLTWLFFKANFTTLKDMLPTNLLTMALEGVSFLDKAADGQDVRDFLAQHATLLTGSEKLIAQDLEWQSVRAAMRTTCEPALHSACLAVL